ncbi:MAG: hypothetical protein H6636_01170 [Anaerolineales bacterium]|nr:hypothetical protein [Anaerolineales bacterium]
MMMSKLLNAFRLFEQASLYASATGLANTSIPVITAKIRTCRQREIEIFSRERRKLKLGRSGPFSKSPPHHHPQQQHSTCGHPGPNARAAIRSPS